jgi:hypothetical protein
MVEGTCTALGSTRRGKELQEREKSRVVAIDEIGGHQTSAADWRYPLKIESRTDMDMLVVTDRKQRDSDHW